jgi:hypothetical protein
MTIKAEPKEGEDKEKLLTELVMDPDFHDLKRQIGEFNILEALGVRRQELRHSDFLAFLLNPTDRHGQGDYFLKRFLQEVLLAAEPAQDAVVSPVELDIWSLVGTQVHRELHNIDVLLVDEAHALAVIIENKIGTGEHTNQLARYRDAVITHFPQCTKILGIYLTPGGIRPSLHEHYLSASYTLLHDLLEDVVKDSRVCTRTRYAYTIAPLYSHAKETHYERVRHRQTV